MNKRIVSIGLSGSLFLGCIAPVIPIIRVSATSCEYNSSLQEKMYKYMLSKSNQDSITNEAIRLHNGDKHNTCVYFISSILRRMGVNIPKGTAYTTNLKNELTRRGWVKETNLKNLKPGDIVFCGTSHVYMFMGWANKEHTIANIVDNQKHIYGTVYRTRYVFGHVIPGDSIRSHDKSTEFYRYAENTSTKITTYKGEVVNINSYLNVRAGNSTNSKIIGSLRRNNKVDIISRVGGWYKILYNNKIAYVSSDYIKPITSNKKNNSNSNKKYGRVDRVNSYLNVRSGPSTQYKSVGSLRQGEKVEILEKKNGWYRIKGRVNGWICGYYLKVL